jgi:hypothetical protein
MAGADLDAILNAVFTDLFNSTGAPWKERTSAPSAAKRGASIFKMMDQSRHRSVETLRGYVRDAEIFKEHAGAGLL